MPTHRCEAFAVRHRLRSKSLASPRGPFMVELFAIGCFARMPTLVIGPVPPVARSRTPHASRVERTIGSGPHGRDLEAFAPSPALSHHGLCPPRGATRHVPVAHIRVRWWMFLWDRTLGLLWFRSSPRQREHEPRITPRSLPRTGGATLMANPALRAISVVGCEPALFPGW